MMGTYTTTLNLFKPAGTDNFDVATLWNDNADKLESAIVAISGSTDPTAATAGIPGQCYINTASNTLWICKTAVSEIYTWQFVCTMQITPNGYLGILESMPAAGEDYYGITGIYIGAAADGYVQGGLYTCTRTGTEGNYVYAWSEIYRAHAQKHHAGGADPLTASDISAQPAQIQTLNAVVAVSSFVADATYTDYNYKADIAIAGVTADMIAEVVFNVAEATSGDYAPVTSCGAGYVRIYASAVPDAAITIPTIIVHKAVS